MISDNGVDKMNRVGEMSEDGRLRQSHVCFRVFPAASGPPAKAVHADLFIVCEARALPRILSHEIGNLPICVIHCWLGSRLKVSQNNEPDAVRMCGSGKM